MAKRIILSAIAIVILICLSGHVFNMYSQKENNTSSGYIYFYGMSSLIEDEADLFQDIAPNGDLIILESAGHWGIIDAGFRYEDSITDSDGTVYFIPANRETESGKKTATGLSCQVEGKNGKDAAAFMHDVLGVDHLDFIIATHGHSDHIGGIPDIAAYTYADAKGVTRSLVDKHTVYLAKPYFHISSLEDDLGQEKQEDSWHNQAFVYSAEMAVRDHNAHVIDITNGRNTAQPALDKDDYHTIIQCIQKAGRLKKVSFEPGVPEDPFDDSLSFTFGRFSICLYNLYSVDQMANDNANSIAVVVTDGISTAFTAGDLDSEWFIEQKVSRAVADCFGKIDLIKADHHGGIGSNTREMLDTLQPKAIVITRCYDMTPNWYDPMTPAIYYSCSQQKYTKEVYETALANKAIVARFDSGGIQYYDLQVNDGDPILTDPTRCFHSNIPRDGWYAWSIQHLTGSDVDYCFFLDGTPVTGWKKIKSGQPVDADDIGNWYYFDSLGIMAQDWFQIEGKWYYFGTNGVMVSNVNLEINGKTYHFAPNGECLDP